MFDNRVTRLLGVEIPIVQAPMGWIARADRHASPALRALRTDYSAALEFDTTTNAFAAFGDQPGVYFRGELDKGIALSGEVAGRIDSVRPVADVITECAADCLTTLADLADAYPPTAPGGRP